MKEIFKFLLSLRIFMFNKVFTKIPVYFIRNMFQYFYFLQGKDTNVMSNVTILNKSLKKNQIIIGDNCIINSDCLIDGRGGKLVIKNNVDIAKGVWILTVGHDPHSDFHSVIHKDVLIEDDVWIASRAIILPGITLGKGCVVAAGAVVTKNVPAMAIVGGNPARTIGVRKSKLKHKNNFFPYLDMI